MRKCRVWARRMHAVALVPGDERVLTFLIGRGGYYEGLEAVEGAYRVDSLCGQPRCQCHLIEDASVSKPSLADWPLLSRVIS